MVLKLNSLSYHYTSSKNFIKTFGKIKLPNTERLSKEIISLPIYPELDFKKVKFIIKMINQFFSYKFKNNLN